MASIPKFGIHRDRDNNRVALNYNGSRILSVSATGLDVVGTITSSGLNTINNILRLGSTGILSFGTGATATIATGVLTATKSYMIMDAEGAGTTDTLDSIVGPGTPADGDL